jgi:hypothetical protein
MKQTMIFSFLVLFVLTGCYAEEEMISASDSLNVKSFGNSVDVHGDFVIVGAPSTTHGSAYNAGSAHIYQKSGDHWIERYKIGASDPVAGAEFGAAAAMDTLYAIVGAPQSHNDGVASGAAYVFRRLGTNWVFQQKLASPFNEMNCFFGAAVDVQGPFAIVGAPLANTSRGAHTGAAAIYYCNGSYWSLIKILVAPDGAYADWFGQAVQIDAANAIVGAPYDDNQIGTNAGAAYIFSGSSSWANSQKLVARGSGAYAGGGLSVSIKGSYAILGAAWESNEKGSGAGAIYFYGLDGSVWRQTHRFVSPYAGDGQHFGQAVDLSTYFAAAGAPYGSGDFGFAYIYLMDNGVWMYAEELYGSRCVYTDHPYFGYSVGLSEEYALFGAPGHKDANGRETGTAYVFKKN